MSLGWGWGHSGESRGPLTSASVTQPPQNKLIPENEEGEVSLRVTADTGTAPAQHWPRVQGRGRPSPPQHCPAGVPRSQGAGPRQNAGVSPRESWHVPWERSPSRVSMGPAFPPSHRPGALPEEAWCQLCGTSAPTISRGAVLGTPLGHTSGQPWLCCLGSPSHRGLSSHQ